MKLAFHTDLALRLVITLAERPEQTVATSELALFHRVSQNHLAKVVQTLRKLGYIEVARGRSGGMRLARPPAEINMGALVRDLEGHRPLVDCTDCALLKACRLPRALSRATQAFYDSLGEQTLADVAL